MNDENRAVISMTPIKCILRSGVQIFTVDHADIATLVCVAASDEQAVWLAWSLGNAHAVEVKDALGLLTMRVQSE